VDDRELLSLGTGRRPLRGGAGSVALALATLAVAGCGGGGQATGADAVPFQCAKLTMALPASTLAAFSDVYAGTGAGSAVAEAQREFDEIAASGPEKLRRDLRFLAAQHRVYAEMLDEVFEEGEEPDKESLQEHDRRLAALETPKLVAARERVFTWIERNC
jgi:hypothetical protein